MKRSLRAVLWLVLVLGLCTGVIPDSSSQQPAKGDPPPPAFRPDTVLVKPRPGLDVAQLAVEHAALNARVDHVFHDLGNIQVVKLPPGLSVQQAIRRYERSGKVQYAEPDYEVRALLTPNDPRFTDGTLWALHNTGQNGGTADADIDAPEAWDARTSAHPIIVAVIDTGVRYTHEDLAGNMWINPGEIAGNGIDDDGNGYVDDVYGINAINNTGDPNDDNGHGTHVAGTIGAIGNNGKGVVGVAWNVRIMALKFLNSNGSGSISDAIKCVNYARLNGAKIMSNSWGGGGFSQAMYDAIKAARDADILFVAAAGNNGANADTSPMYPAAYDLENIISVAATDRNDNRASFSNYGAVSVDLGAPGVSILSTYHNNNSAYATLSGTSMACPHVSGAAALVWAQHPALNYSQIKARILASTDPIASLAGITVTGGRLNVHKALIQDPIADFTASPLAGEPPLTVTFTDTSLGNITSRSLDFGDGSPPTSSTSTTYQYDSVGVYNATLTVTGPGGSSSKTRPITVATNYVINDCSFSWMNTSSMTAITLGDDQVSGGIDMPFSFTYYENSYNRLFISSNGFIMFGSTTGGTTWVNSDIPAAAAPNNAIYPYWDDLYPPGGGQIRHGAVGSSPNRVYVVSWEGIPHYSYRSTTFSFQVLLFEGSNEIMTQYLEVQPAHSAVGAGRSATIGVENINGTIARKHGFNTTSVANNQCLSFSFDASSPPPPPTPGALAVSPSDGFSSSGNEGGPFSPSSKSYTLTNSGGESINWTASKSQSWVSLSSTSGSLAPGNSVTVTVSINSNANSLPPGSHSDTVNFSNTTNGNGNTSRTVTLTVNPTPGALAVSPSDGFSSSGNEGGPFSPSSKSYTLTNSGGESINWTASKSQSWVSLSSTSGSLAPGNSVTVTVSINSNANSLPPGSHSDTVNFSNTTNGNGNTSRSVSLTVTSEPSTPGALAVSPSTDLTVSGSQGGPFSSSAQTYTLSNTGGESINWTASKSQSWVSLSSTSGSLAPGNSVSVTVSINSNANSLAPGSYSDTVNFSNTTNGNGNTSRTVSLTISPCLPDAPSNLSASASGPAFNRVMVLNWTDNANCETSFQIERAVGNGSFQPLVTLNGADITSHTDNTIERKKTYRYRVRACNDSGCSSWSNTAQHRVP
jgi:subtilisin family serine protease